MIQRHQIQGILESEWAATKDGLFSEPIEAAVGGMMERIQDRIDETPSTLISHYQMAPLGTRELKFTVIPGPGNMAEVVRLNKELGACFQFTGAQGAQGDGDEIDLTFTPGNGMAAVLTQDRPKGSFPMGWSVFWMIVGALSGWALAWFV